MRLRHIAGVGLILAVAWLAWRGVGNGGKGGSVPTRPLGGGEGGGAVERAGGSAGAPVAAAGSVVPPGSGTGNSGVAPGLALPAEASGTLDPSSPGAFVTQTVRALAGPSNLAERVAIYRTDFKYPFLRVEETVWRDPATGGERVLRASRMVADHVVVGLRPGVPPAALDDLARRRGLRVRRQLGFPHLFLVAAADGTPDANTLPRLLAACGAETGIVRFAEADRFMRICQTRMPNDGGFSMLWGMHNIGQSGGTPDADMDMPEAWAVATGTGGVVVGIIDTGVDYLHPDLAANAWINPREIPGNGMDDDRNGYVDDVRGWDFRNEDNDPMDDNTHGTHVAGTIAAVGNNGIGVAGVCWRARLLPLKAFSATGDGADSDIIQALHYAVTMRTNGVGLRVTNNSYGDTTFAQGLADAALAAERAGLLLIAAAGNDGADNDVTPHYPSSLAYTSVIAVASSDRWDGRSSFSSYGRTSVDLAAPGSEIRSTLPGDYGDKSGTSMATPHVTGLAALIWDLRPDLSAGAVRDAIFAGTDALPAFANRTVTGGRANARKAIRALVPGVFHQALTNTANVGASYTVQARIVPSPFVATNRAWVLWNTTGRLDAFATGALVRVSGDLFQASIPTQSMGATVFYWLRAESLEGRVGTHPAHAPAELHRFEIVSSLPLLIGWSPDAYGEATPAYGLHRMPSGVVVHASASAFSQAVGGTRQRCAGWGGGGSVPLSGATNEVFFTLHRASALTWLWRQQHRLTQAANPAGPVNSTNWWDAGALAATVTAPVSATFANEPYRFTGWAVDGARWPDPTNTAANPAVGIAMHAPRSALASYLLENRDSDGDGMGDWWELLFFGSLAAVPGADADRDGFANAVEFGDRTDPRRAESRPAPPLIEHAALGTPQRRPPPFEIRATITDTRGVAGATLYWARESQPFASVPMTLADGVSLYAASLPGPVTNGGRVAYYIVALDMGGRESRTATNLLTVAYPSVVFSPGAFADLALRGGSVTNLTLRLRNMGRGPMNWRLDGAMLETFDREIPGWTHAGRNDLWRRSTYRAYSSPTAWYCGDDATHRYRDSMDASLFMPPFVAPAGARLSFWHWLSAEYDKDRQDDHYWDGAVIEVSTNGGLIFAQIPPVGGYPNRVTPNDASPFPPHQPCFGGAGGWRRAEFDLGAFAGREAHVKFRFGSDGYEVEEGWYVDDVAVTPAPTGQAWVACEPAAGALAAGATTDAVVTVDGRRLASGAHRAFLRLTCDDPARPTNEIPVSAMVRWPPVTRIAFAGQVSRDGSGEVAISNRVHDADGDACDVEVFFSTDAGRTWTNAWRYGVRVDFGAPVVSNRPRGIAIGDVPTLNGLGATTNRLDVLWSTTNGASAIWLATEVKVMARAWDGRYWSDAVTSAPFMVDNEIPGPPMAVLSTTHGVHRWSNSNRIGLRWSAASDGGGIGVERYRCSFLQGLQPPSAETNSTGLTVHSPPLPDGVGWIASVTAVDAYGNVGVASPIGPFRVDAHPPLADGATLSFAVSPNGRYVVGDRVGFSWTGFRDGLSGIAGYYYSLADGGGTTNGQWTTAANAVVSGAHADRTNTVYVWAADQAGGIGPSAMGKLLVLSPTGDYDADRLPNAAEEVAGTSAEDAGRSLVLGSGYPVDGSRNAILSWAAVSNRIYSVWSRGAMDEGAWHPFRSITNVAPWAGFLSCTDSVDTVTRRFYLLSVELAP